MNETQVIKLQRASTDGIWYHRWLADKYTTYIRPYTKRVLGDASFRDWTKGDTELEIVWEIVENDLGEALCNNQHPLSVNKRGMNSSCFTRATGLKVSYGTLLVLWFRKPGEEDWWTWDPNP